MTGINSVSVRLGGASERPTSTVATVKKVSAKTTKDLEAARLELTPSSLESLEIVVAAAEMDSVYDPTDLSAWAPLLSPKASVSVRVETENGATLNLQPIHTSFLLAGLVGGSERRESDGSRVITAAKENIATSAGPVTLKKSVLINLDDNDTDLIDEDGLLAEEGSGLLAPPPAVSEIRTATDDCGGRKACDNCSCGRAERESGSKPEKKPEQVASSSCGNCAKGDAFRCASCPYLGKPAFKPGEEHLVLNLEDDL